MAINKLNLNGTVYDIGEAEGTNTAESIVEFASGDELDPTSPDESVELIKSGESHQTLWEKISTGMKNIRWLLKRMGTTDLSSIGDGTATGAITTNAEKIEELNQSLSDFLVTTDYYFDTIQVSSTTPVRYTLNITPPSGYKSLGIVSASTGHDSVGVSRFMINNDVITLGLYAFTNTTYTLSSAYVKVLSVKQI